jgi:hypothetical protein
MNRDKFRAVEPELEQILRTVLSEYESKSGKMFTITFKEIGALCNPAKIGDPEERKYKWKVEIPPMRPKFSYEYYREEIHVEPVDSNPFEYPSLPTEPELLELNGIYDSYEAICDKITEIRLKNALELHTHGKSSLKAWRVVKTDNKPCWTLTCGECGNEQSMWSLCQNQKCVGKLNLIPSTMLDCINVEDGRIYYSCGGSVSICTNLGKVMRVK